MKKAFTLIELLTVTAILAILAAILFPIFVSAKKRAKEAVTISNLRQCSTSIIMYCDDYDGLRSMPSYENAKTILVKAPTCDSLEYWRTSCEQNWGEPLIGSYGYVRGVQDFVTKDDDWFKYLEEVGENPTIFVSPWHGQSNLIRFHGDSVPITCLPLESCRFPNRMAFAKADSSVKIQTNSFGGTRPSGGFDFTWSAAFYAGR